jgi:co-chaperonin GroES (HSP10)
MKMSKNNKVKLIGATGEELHTPMPKLTGCTPCGSQVLIEVLTAQELMNTVLTVTGTTDTKTTLQAYVRAVGPGTGEHWGFKVGDRVLFSGFGVMAPNIDNNPRDCFLVEPQAIKGVLSEAK